MIQLSLGASFLAACTFPGPGMLSGSATAPALSPSLPAATATIAYTATPAPITVWVSPALPEALRAPLNQLSEAGGRPVVMVSEAQGAVVRAEAKPELVLSTWIYTVASRFATIEDELSLEGLQRLWKGEVQGPLYATAETEAAIEALLGSPAEGAVTLVDTAALVERVWGEEGARGIVPFPELEPRLKVLTVSGISPVHMGFDAGAYALSVPFGLSGEAEAVEALRQVVEWPASNRDPNRMTVLVMTGVTALTRATAYRMENYGILSPSQLIGEWLRGADLTHTSNEVSFTDACPPPNPVQEGLLFCASPRYLPLLDDIGLDVIELTGNHNNDWGHEASLQSLELYRQRGWKYFGGGENLEDAFRPALVEHNGNKLAFLGCNSAGPGWAWAESDAPGAAPCDMDRLLSQVTQLRQEGYLPIFTFQWTREDYVYTASPAMVEDFHRPIDAGAVLVNGSQAHQPKGFEFYGGGLIHYGLGNLFFDQMWALGTRQEFIDRHIFYDGRHLSTVLQTAMLEYYAQPRPMTAQERASFLADIFAASRW